MKITRHQLYERVWTKPMMHLSKEFGLSDVGLAKICRKNGIPIPERGYWAKIDAGYKAPKKALPRKDYNPKIVIQEKPPITEDIVKAKQEQKEKQSKTLNQLGNVEVSRDLTSPHRMTKMTQKYFEEISKKIARNAKIKDWAKVDWNDRAPHEDYGRYQCWPENGYHLKVSMTCVHRALCFLDALVHKLEQLGFVFEQSKDKNQYGREQEVAAVKDGERIYFKLLEGYKQAYLTGKALELARKKNSWTSGIQRAPSGIFTFKLYGKEDRWEKRFVDGAKKLEECLPLIVAEFINRVDNEKRYREKKISDEIARKEREKIRWIEQNRQAERHRQYTESMNESEHLKQFNQLESYLAQLESAYLAQNEELDENVEAWFKLVRFIAKDKHPISSRLEYLNNIRKIGTEKLEWM